jgi:hypothetical protein
MAHNITIIRYYNTILLSGLRPVDHKINYCFCRFNGFKYFLFVLNARKRDFEFIFEHILFTLSEFISENIYSIFFLVIK